MAACQQAMLLGPEALLDDSHRAAAGGSPSQCYKWVVCQPSYVHSRTLAPIAPATSVEWEKGLGGMLGALLSMVAYTHSLEQAHTQSKTPVNQTETAAPAA